MKLSQGIGKPDGGDRIICRCAKQKVSLQDGWIQASAAAGALVAGVLAYVGAVRQVRIQERAQKVRALAYSFRLLRVV